jgi:hypothetical protein
MAPRRLLILMLAVLAISTLGAALIAPRPGGQDQATTAAEARGGHTKARQRPGRLIEVRAGTRSPRPESIHARPGDQLELTVRSATPGQIEIPRFGLLEDAGPDMPAHFSVFFDEPGRFNVRLATTGRVVARIVVSGAT